MAKSKTKPKGNGIVESAVDAAEELGAAATAFKETWSHIKKAQSKARPAAHAAARAGKKAWGATKRTARKATRAAKKAR